MSKLPKIAVDTSDASWRTYLDAASMYLHGAGEALVRAKAKWKAVEATEDRIQSIYEEEDRAKEEFRDNPRKLGDRLESLAIQLVDSEQYDLEQSYGNAVMECSLVHILCAGAAEAYVNATAEARLSRQEWEAFDKLALEGKWLFLPRLLNVEGFDPGTEPFQSFKSTVRYRNALMHHRALREEWQVGRVPPKALEKLGLSISAAEGSFEGTIELIEALAERLGADFGFRRDGHTKFFA